MAAAVAGTVGGLYIVITQDTGAGHHDDHHGEAHETHDEKEGGDEKLENDESKDEEPKKTGEGMAQGGPKDEAKTKDKNTDSGNEQSDNAGSAATGRPDKKKAADSSKDAPKADEAGAASPDKSDKVGVNVVTCDLLRADFYRLILAASPRALTKPPASKKVSQIPTRTTAQKSPRIPPRARRVRVSPRLLSSRAPSRSTAPALRTRRSEARPSRRMTSRAQTPALPASYSVFDNTSALTLRLAAACIVCELKLSVSGHISADAQVRF
jgi:hypothetical protein